MVLFFLVAAICCCSVQTCRCSYRKRKTASRNPHQETHHTNSQLAQISTGMMLQDIPMWTCCLTEPLLYFPAVLWRCWYLWPLRRPLKRQVRARSTLLQREVKHAACSSCWPAASTSTTAWTPGTLKTTGTWGRAPCTSPFPTGTWNAPDSC